MKILLAGAGRTGSYLYQVLKAEGHQVQVIESRCQVYGDLPQTMQKDTILGSAADTSVLEEAGVANCDLVAAVTPDDEVNLVVSTLAKMEYGVPRVVARVNDPANAWLFTAEMGVDAAVNSASIMGRVIIDEMAVHRSHLMAVINQSDYEIVELVVQPGSSWDQSLVSDLVRPEDSLLVTIQRGDQVILPQGDTQLQAQDKVVVLVREPDLAEIENLV